MVTPPPQIPGRVRGRTRGLSIIELSITITVLGAAFLLVLKGTALVEAAKAFIASYQIEQIQNKVVYYQAEYKALPGNDAEAAGRWNLPEPATTVLGADVSFGGDGELHGLLSDPLSPNGEQYMAWRHLRAAGLMEGDVAVSGASAAPENPFGGIYGFDEGNLGQKDGSLCLTDVPGRAAEIIDRRLDDGVINKGRVVATSKYDPNGAKNHFDQPDKAPYDYAKRYIVCIPMMP